MTWTALFAVGSAAVGLAQLLDSVALARRNGLAQGWHLAFSALEYVWAAACLGVLLLAETSWCTKLLAQVFVAYIPVAVLVAWISDPKLLTRASDAVAVPMPAVWLGGVFGVVYASLAVAIGSLTTSRCLP